MQRALGKRKKRKKGGEEGLEVLVYYNGKGQSALQTPFKNNEKLYPCINNWTTNLNPSDKMLERWGWALAHQI